MSDAVRPTPSAAEQLPVRRSWLLPTLAELPKLTKLTLASAIGGGGGTGGGGSTVFTPFLVASALVVSSLAGCSVDESTGPSGPEMPKPVAAINCTGEIATLKVTCAGPVSSSGVEILGSQGIQVALRSSNVSWNGILGVLTFDVSLQNLSTQKLGWTGTTPTGESVFFVNGPVADVGSVNVDFALTGTFTAPGQTYYQYIGMLDPLQTSAPKTWQFHMNTAATTFSFTVMVAADVYDLGGVLEWKSVAGTTQMRYNDVVASSPTDRMAVGNGGLTAHYTGGEWVPLPMVTYEQFNAVTAIGAGEYLAVTGSGAVFHFKNRVWTELYHRGDYGPFYSIWAKDLTHIVAVGQGGRISRLYGGTWDDVDVTTANNGNLVAVSGNADGSKVSAVNGDYLNTEVWTSTAGGGFVLDPNLPPFAGIGLDITYDAAGNALLASVNSGVGTILSSTGDILLSDPDLLPLTLTPHGTGKVTVGALSSGDYKVVEVDYSASFPGTVTSLSDPVPGGNDIAQLTPTNSAGTEFSIISGVYGHLLSWNGATWTDDQGDGNWTDPDIWGSGTTLWALDGFGGFYKIINGVMTPLPGQSGLTRFWGSSSTSFWGVGSSGVWHSDGTGAWTPDVTFGFPGGITPRDVWADPTGAAVIVLGDGGHIASFVGGGWSYEDIGHHVTAVWGCDVSNAWVVTDDGEIWKWFNGTTTFLASVGPNPLQTITGHSCSDIWVGGDNGKIYHGSGGPFNWDDKNIPGLSWTIRALSIRGPFQVIGAGDGSNSGLFSESAPVATTILPAQGGTVTSLWRLDNGDMYAAGNQFLLRGTR